MKKILVLLCSLLMFFALGACRQTGQDESSQVTSESSRQAEVSSKPASSSETSLSLSDMIICVTTEGHTATFQLYDTTAAAELYAQLPLTIEVENYSTNEKIFYPPQELDVSDAPQANAVVGTLAYYAPWGDVVMYYEDFGSASGLYELGRAVSGSEHISGMSGTIEIQQSGS